MNAKINKNGDLLIKRKGVFRKQFCPFSTADDCCGDWCPKFDDDIAFKKVIVCGEEIDIIVDERDYKNNAK